MRERERDKGLYRNIVFPQLTTSLIIRFVPEQDWYKLALTGKILFLTLLNTENVVLVLLGSGLYSEVVLILRLSPKPVSSALPSSCKCTKPQAQCGFYRLASTWLGFVIVFLQLTTGVIIRFVPEKPHKMLIGLPAACDLLAGEKSSQLSKCARWLLWKTPSVESVTKTDKSE